MKRYINVPSLLAHPAVLHEAGAGRPTTREVMCTFVVVVTEIWQLYSEIRIRNERARNVLHFKDTLHEKWCLKSCNIAIFQSNSLRSTQIVSIPCQNSR